MPLPSPLTLLCAARSLRQDEADLDSPVTRCAGVRLTPALPLRILTLGGMAELVEGARLETV